MAQHACTDNSSYTHNASEKPKTGVSNMQNSREPFEITVTNKRSTEISLFKLLKEQMTNRENGKFHMIGKNSSRLPSSCKF